MNQPAQLELGRSWLALGAAAAALAALIVLAAPAALLPLLAVAIGLLTVGACLLRPTWAIWLTLGLLFFGDRSNIPQLVFWGRYLPTAGVALLVFCVVVRRAAAGRWAWAGAPLIVGYGLFALLVVASALFNGSSARDLALSLATNLRYPLFFVILLNMRLPATFYRRVLTVFVALSLLQIPVTLAQFALGQKGDFLTGTFGSNVNLVAATLISQFILLARWLNRGRRGWLYLTLIGVLFIPYLLGDVQIGLLLFPLVALFMLLRHYGLRRLGRFVLRGAALLALSAVIVAVVATTAPAVRSFLSVLPEHWENLQTTDPYVVSNTSVGRVTILRFAVPMLFEDPVRAVWGFGPEATNGGLLGATLNNRMARPESFGSMGVVCQELALRGVVCREPQSFRAVMDFGLLGSALYLLPQLLLWGINARLRPRLPAGEARATPLLFEGLCFFYVFLGVWYIGVWRLDSYSLMFWLTAAAIFAERRASSEPGVTASREGS